MRRLISVVAALAALLAPCGSAVAQTQRSPGGSQVTQQVQQLASERTQLLSEVNRLKSALEEANSNLAAAKRERDQLKATVDTAAATAVRAQASNEASTQSLEQTKKKLDELVARFRELATQMRDVEQDRNALKQSLATRSGELDRCADDNVQLAGVAEEVLDRFEQRGFWDRVAVSEPFTHIARNRLENLADAYRARAKAATYMPPASPPAERR